MGLHLTNISRIQLKSRSAITSTNVTTTRVAIAVCRGTKGILFFSLLPEFVVQSSLCAKERDCSSQRCSFKSNRDLIAWVLQSYSGMFAEWRNRVDVLLLSSYNLQVNCCDCARSCCPIFFYFQNLADGRKENCHLCLLKEISSRNTTVFKGRQIYSNF